jgi:hypothetical protein
MIILGIVLAVIGLLIGSPLLLWIGVALIIIGLVFNIGGVGGPRRGGGRRYWY